MALVEHNEITFELFQLFFRPNSVVYMVSANSGKPRCLMFDSGQVKTYNGKKVFEMDCHYLTHDGKRFGEAPTTTEISEFHGVMKVASLGVYPLEYHTKKERIIEELIERGHKLVDLIKTWSSPPRVQRTGILHCEEGGEEVYRARSSHD